MSNQLWNQTGPPIRPFPDIEATEEMARLFDQFDKSSAADLAEQNRPFEVKGGDFLPSRRSKWQTTW